MYRADEANRPVSGFVLGPQSPRGDTGESRTGPDLDESLKVEVREKEVLGFDPADWGRELIGHQFDEDGVGVELPNPRRPRERLGKVRQRG